MRTMQIAAAALVVLAFLTAFWVYPSMPEKVASHWNAEGNVDGHMGRDFGVFFMPALSLAMLAFFFILPKIDPLRKNYKAFQKEYETFIVLIIGFFYYVYLLTLAINLGYMLNITQFLAPAFGMLFIYTGTLIEKAKQNWFVGVRTPWTLASESVWDKTHAITGKLFKAAGLVAFLGVAMPSFGLMASIAILLAAAVFSFVYSYVEFEREKKETGNRKRYKR